MKYSLQVQQTQPSLWQDTDITYAQVPHYFGYTTRDLKLSIIRHRDLTPNPSPLLVWICGGGYETLDKNAHLPGLVEFVKQGYIVASVEYRTLNQAKFPAQLEDVKAAIRFLRARAAQYGIDPDRVGVMGESAGGHLAALAGTTGHRKEFDKGDYLNFSSAVNAVCDWYGITNALKFGDDMVAYLTGVSPVDDAEPGADTNVLHFLTENTPPFLILHGDKDNVVPIAQSDVLYDALNRHNVPVDYYVVAGAGHATIEFFQPQVTQIILEFFNRYLK